MQFYQCPNCGRKYSEFENKFYCGTCNYKLLKEEDIKGVKYPELSQRKYNVVGEIQDPTKPIVTCPYCKSANTSKVTMTSKAVNTVIFGLLGTKRYKQWHCNSCNSDF